METSWPRTNCTRVIPRGFGVSSRGAGTAFCRRASTSTTSSSPRWGVFFRAARQGAYHVPQGGELWQLLAAITRHKLSHARVKHRAAKRDARRTVSCREAVGSLAGEEERLAQELRLLIEDMIRGFSPTERKIVELRIEGYELHDIAQRTARSRRTVERVLQGFREDLLRAYQADERE